MNISFPSPKSLALAALTISNTLLLVILFYFLIPQMELRRPEAESADIVTKMIRTSSADLAIYWNIRLDKNSRSVSAFKTRSPTDETILIKFLKQTRDVKLTVALKPNDISALLSNNVLCDVQPFLISQIISISSTAIEERDFFNNLDSYVCLIPITNKSQMLVGHLSVAWKHKPPAESINAALIQAQGLVQ
jgi:hypothetical protein